MNKNNIYTKDSIESLSPLEFTRLRPAVYCGSTEYSTQLLTEICSNSIDEFKAGHGNCIKIDTLKDNTIIVEDNAQGFIPNAKRKDNKTILEAAFSVLNTSAKYSEDGVYSGISLGLNGIGAKLATYLSHWLEVMSWRDGEFEHIWFKEGKFEKRESGKWDNKNKPSGTIVQWKPSEEFFTHPEINESEFIKLIKVLVCLCPGLKIIYNGKEYLSKKGINDLIDENTKGTEIIKNRFNLNWAEGKNEIELVMTYTSNYSSTIVPYVNTGLTDTGPHITQIKTTITKIFNKFLREKKWLKDKDDNLTGDDIQEGMYLVFNMTAPNVGYDAQIKSRITKIDTKPFIKPFTEAFEDWLKGNEKEVKLIADKALSARKAREAAKKARDSVRQPKEKGLKAKLALSKKFTDCINKSPSQRNLLLVEGTSAASSAIEARNPKTDCIYQLRGKIISPLKTDVTKLLQNQEISDIIRVIGAGFGKDFNLSKMNFDKIIITSDQDSDGFAIELLLLTFFYTYMRPLVEAGKLYRAVTPLYIVRKGKEELYFFSEKEMEDWRSQGKSGYEVLRAKG